jgi:hypothetical protein
MGTYKPTTISPTEVTGTSSLGGVPSSLGTPFPVRMAERRTSTPLVGEHPFMAGATGA